MRTRKLTCLPVSGYCCSPTEGIAEAFAPDGQEFGENRIAATALAHVGLSARELNRLLLAEVGNFCDAQFHDDATLVVIAGTDAAHEERRP